MKQTLRIGLITIAALTLTGCRAVEYVPYAVPSVQTVYRDRTTTDSLVRRDSIHIRSKGDTVYVDRWHTELRDRLLTDTIIRRDSIPVPVEVPVEVEVEREPAWYDRLFIAVGRAACAAFIAWIFYLYLRRKH